MTTRRRRGGPSGARVIAVGAGLVSAALGAAVLVGAYVHDDVVTRILAAFPAVPCNTAPAFLVAGIALVAGRRSGVSICAGGLTVMVGLVVLVESFLGVDLAIDDLIVPAAVADPGRHRMVIAAALAFSLAGIALLVGRGATRRRNVASVLGAAVIGVGAVGALESVTALGLGVSHGPVPAMGMHTALGFLVVGAGIVARTREGTRAEAADEVGWLPLVVGIGVVGLVVLLWALSMERESRQFARVVDVQSQAVRNEISDRLSSIILGLDRMGRRWEAQEQPQRPAWAADASLYLGQEESLEAIEWVEPSFLPRWRVEREGSARSRASESRIDAGRRTAPTGGRGRAPAISHPVSLRPGGRGVLVWIPMYRSGRSSGFLVGTVRFTTLLDPILQNVALDSSVTVLEGDEELYRGGSDAPVATDARTVAIPLDVVHWRVRVAPAAAMVADAHNPMIDAAMILGIVLAVGLGMAIHLRQTSDRRAAEREAEQNALRDEMAERKTMQGTLGVLNFRLEERTRELARSNAALEQFAARASHDLQEPLRAVTGCGEILARRYRGRLDADGDGYIRQLVDGVTRVRALVEDLVVFARAGNAQGQFETMDAAAAFTAAVGRLEPAIREAGATVTHDDLPTVAVDADELARVFEHLVGNAIKFRGDEPPIVRVSAARANGEWVFAVRDNGIGVEPQYGERIFGMLERLHPGNGNGRTGLGLAICKRIIERHGGRIWVESEPGSGSSFFFSLPGDEPPDESAPAVVAT